MTYQTPFSGLWKLQERSQLRPALALMTVLLVPTAAIRGQSPLDATTTPAEVWIEADEALVVDASYYFAQGTSQWTGSNLGTNLSISVAPDTLLVTIPDSAGNISVALATSSFGREGSLSTLTTGSLSGQLNRVVTTRGELIEWVENSPVGIEQGFDIGSPLPGSGPLVLAVTVTSSLEPVVTEDGLGVLFVDSRGERRLRYADLRATDANSAVLPAWISLAGSVLSLHVDDSKAAYPITIDPLITPAQWSRRGLVPDGWFAYSVAAGGDLNGDGTGDIVVGAPDTDTDGVAATREGRVFVFLGTSTGPSTTAACTVSQGGSDARFGTSVTAGDFDSDGFLDIAVGAPGHRLSGCTSTCQNGKVYILWGTGASTGCPLDSQTIWSADLGTNSENTMTGFSVARARSVNSDSVDDLLVGVPGLSSAAGGLRIYYGVSSGDPTTSPNWSYDGSQSGARLGMSVAGMGDINGDGIGDFAAGAPYYDESSSLVDSGQAILFLGSPGTSPNWSAVGGQAFAHFATSVGRAGDLNHDGYADLVVGAPLYDAGQMNEGAVFVWTGGSGGLSGTPPVAASSAAMTLESNQAGALFGISTATAGDINADGYADLAVGAPLYDWDANNDRLYEGRVFLFSGTNCDASGVSTAIVQTLDNPMQGGEVTNFGFAVTAAGDTNGDGLGDLLVGGYREDDPGATGTKRDFGRGFVFQGAPGGYLTSSTQVVSNPGGASGAAYGSTVVWLGDVNGDGYSDLAVGAPNYDPDSDGINDFQGLVEVYFGSSTGIAATPSWRCPGTNTGDCGISTASFPLGTSFGSAIAGEDLNGDTFVDLIVGARDDGSGAGKAYVFYSSGCGLESSTCTPPLSRTERAGASGELFGAALAGLGDMDGDGFGDLLTGSPGYSSSKGRAMVIRGSANGLPTSGSAWSKDGANANDKFGSAVVLAGDLNADGFSDIAIGAPFEGSAPALGKAHVFYGESSTYFPSTASWTCPGTCTTSFPSPDSGGTQFGASFASGDFNRDGKTDLFVGAPGYTNDLTDEGRVYGYAGAPSGLSTGELSWAVEGNNGGAKFGSSLSVVGDINADIYQDILVGAPGDSSGAGKAWLFTGGGTVPSTTAAWSVTGSSSNALGTSVAGGEWNGDGFPDLLIGRPGANAANTYLGNTAVLCSGGGGGKFKPVQLGINPVGSKTPIKIGNSNRPGESVRAFWLGLSASSAAGRTRVRLLYEVEPFEADFSPANIQSTDFFDTGAVSGGASSYHFEQLVTTPTTGWKKWRVRIATKDPMFPGTGWLTLAGNGPREADIVVRQ